MKKFFLWLLVLSLGLGALAPVFAAAPGDVTTIKQYLTRFRALRLNQDARNTFDTSTLQNLYREQSYRSFWFTSSGNSNGKLVVYLDYVSRISQAGRENQERWIPHLQYISSRLSGTNWITLELLASHSLTVFLSSKGAGISSNWRKMMTANASQFRGLLEGIASTKPQTVITTQPATPSPAPVVRAAPVTGSAGAVVIPGSAQSFLRSLLANSALRLGGEVIYTDQLQAFYRMRNYQPAWFDNRQLSGRLPLFLDTLRVVNNSGKANIWVSMTRNNIKNFTDRNWMTLEIVATHALLTYLNANNISDYREIAQAFLSDAGIFENYLRYFSLTEQRIVRAQPVEEESGISTVPAPQISERQEVIRYEYPIGVSNARYANDITNDDVNKFYAAIGTTNVWTNAYGSPNDWARSLRSILRNAHTHGLDPNDYWDKNLDSLYYNGSYAGGSQFEKRASYAFLRYVNHLYSGRLNPQEIDSKYFKFSMRKFTDYKALVQILQLGAYQLKTNLEAVSPQVPQYRQLMGNMARLYNLKMEGKWRVIAAPQRSLKLGQSHVSVPDIRAQLNNLGYPVSTYSNIYDAELETAIKNYLKAQNLPAPKEGKVDSRFWKSLNKTVDERILQVQINLEKLRWVPRAPRDRFAFVNTAAQELTLFRAGRVAMKFRTVNGREGFATPSMLQQSRRVILNPTWTVPAAMAVRAKLPEIQKDPNYLKNNNMRILDASTDSEVDVSQVDWAGFTGEEGTTRYRIIQGPGNSNALGVLKFPLQNMDGTMNTDDIYMHDTNERYLFENASRYDSSGCIRLQEPLKFAAELLKDTTLTAPDGVKRNWTEADIRAFVPWDNPQQPVEAERMSRSISFARDSKTSLLVYVMYMTNDQTETGAVRFFEDFYKLDVKIAEALKASM